MPSRAVTCSPDRANPNEIATGEPAGNPEELMRSYQCADPDSATALVNLLSPALLRFFRSEPVSREQAEDLLQETWMRIHRVRHTYRPGEPFLPWMYAIARRVRVDGYRRSRRITAHESAASVLPDVVTQERESKGPSFEGMLAVLPASQREVIVMLKAGGLSLEEVARATASTVGSVKQKAHRAYTRLREVFIAGE